MCEIKPIAKQEKSTEVHISWIIIIILNSFETTH